MNYINKLLCLFLLLGAGLLSCSKKNDTKPVTNTAGLTAEGLTFKGNDTTQTLSNCYFQSTSANGVPATFIGANNETANGQLSGNTVIVMEIIDAAGISAGKSYTAAEIVTSNQTRGVLFEYTNPYGQLAETVPNGGEPTMVTITAATSTYIKGTFSGKLYNEQDTDLSGPGTVITGGSFYALIKSNSNK